MEIIKLDPRQIKRAAEVLALSFFDYPMFAFYFPDPKRRTRYLPWYFTKILKHGTTLWHSLYHPRGFRRDFHPASGTYPNFIMGICPEWFFADPIVLGFRNYKRSMECENFVGATHIELMKNRPHYYLWGLAVEPAVKSQGIGSALMQPLLAQADAQKMPIYLETHDEKNVRYYQKHGFDLLHTACIPKYQLSIWCMMRESV